MSIQNNLVFSLTKSCEDTIRENPAEAASMMANMIAALAVIKMRGAVDHDKIDPTVMSWVIDIMNTCETLVGDALYDYPGSK